MKTVAQENAGAASWGFDDAQPFRYRAACAKAARRWLRRDFVPVFRWRMIDEFQDTDPQQCQIFRRIWRHSPDTALLLIGDPKQAIYAFSQMNDAFMFRDIPFSPVKFAPVQSLQFVRMTPQPAMTRLMEGKAVFVIIVIWRAQVCATQIRDWLRRANGRRAADERRFVVGPF